MSRETAMVVSKGCPGALRDREGRTVDGVVSHNLPDLLDDAIVAYLLDVLGVRDLEADVPVVLVVVPAHEAGADPDMLGQRARPGQQTS
jgi:hypothetical protein